MPSSHLFLCRPLLLLSSVLPSIRVFSDESALCIRWPKYWSFSFSISPSNEYPGLISFRMDWLDLPAVQGTLKSLLQHRSSKASIFQHSAFFTVQLSHPYMTTGKTIALTRRTFVDSLYYRIQFSLHPLINLHLGESKQSCNVHSKAPHLQEMGLRCKPTSLSKFIISPDNIHGLLEEINRQERREREKNNIHLNPGESK